ncbi:MAG: double-strand break repair helicase AddA [Paracoccaceae bacterium]|nr:double-strand break repair helicase AddA [Paracoccaceae bacterium]
MSRDAATQAQVDAARPNMSTWLSANAGSGKTRVLTDRVARLLLDEVLPEHILCLTYTKAAATEMQNRLFKRLGGWAMESDVNLRGDLRALGVEGALTDDDLKRARTLFARAIETPGGLRIQTIHSFCAALLRRFPLEAQVSPQFTEMEDRAAELLRAEVLDRMSDGPHAALVAGIAPYVNDGDIDKLLAEITKHREAFGQDVSQDALRRAYDLPPGTDEESLIAEVFHSDTLTFVTEVAGLCLTEGSGNDIKLGEKLRAVVMPDMAGFQALQAAFLTTTFEPRKKLFNKALTEGAMAPHLPRIEALMDHVVDSRQRLLALAAMRRDQALYGFAQVFLPAYETAKQLRGWLDFDDLITRARDLLSDDAVAAWVLYRLDGGIDHILVDEAQDTSPVQWQVIERLAQEFTAGEGARADVLRTIFVVGDKKQSIYSFQGADPREFDRMRDDFAARLQATDTPLCNMVLEYSFRSASPILRLVDTTFDTRAESGFVADQKHIAFKDAMPGRVDLWPVVEKVAEQKDGPWYQPVDRVSEGHHDVILANRIAQFVHQTIDARTPLPIEIGQTGTYQSRPVHAGDFLVLVRGRKRLFSEIIRACKQMDIPIAGADKLRVMAELAVRDIVALLSFLATPEDDLSLATVLRSPLFGQSEQTLFDLAHRRPPKQFLWTALRDRSAAFPEVMAVINDLRDQTDYMRPYDLINRVLTRHKGRQRLIGRLGQEAEDGINALLQQALAYEQTEVPSLTGFLQWVQTDNLEIKRAPDAAGDRLRVMTVHGAKGLEAPIVILPDSAQHSARQMDPLLTDVHGVAWRQNASDMPQRQREISDAKKQADARESDRLLYVAMTRAEKWLIVAAAGELGKDGRAWHEQVRRGMEASGAVPAAFPFGDLGTGTGLRLEEGDWAGLPLVDDTPPAITATTLPAFFNQPASETAPKKDNKSPSDLGGAKALPGAAGDTEEAAKTRGTLLHDMLETLSAVPPVERIAVGQSLFSCQDDAPLLQEALTVLDNPQMARFFAPGTLAEVPVTADLPGLGRLHGMIDRLIVTADTVTAVDFKSNRTVPQTPSEVPEGLLRQMGAYAAMLALVYPDYRIETGLIWTASNQYMPLSHDIVTQALARAATS